MSGMAGKVVNSTICFQESRAVSARCHWGPCQWLLHLRTDCSGLRSEWEVGKCVQKVLASLSRTLVVMGSKEGGGWLREAWCLRGEGVCCVF